MKQIGTVVRGIRGPLIRKGDDLAEIVVNAIEGAIKEGDIKLNDRDIIAVTEAVLARAQGNVATIDQVAKDIASKVDCDTVGLVFPIFSRNRFSTILKGLAMGVKNLVVMLNYPFDEVGNPLLQPEVFDEMEIDESRTFTEAEFRAIFKEIKHPFTGMDYIKEFTDKGGNISIILSNTVTKILDYTDTVIVGGIHNRNKLKQKLIKHGARNVIKLDEIMSKSIDGSGYNEDYGVLGSNLATDTSLKLFPRDCEAFCYALQAKIKERFNVNMECMVYGDGAFKDAQYAIWELADPVVSPGFTKGLLGTNNELKLKYIADNQLSHLNQNEAIKEMKEIIKQKDSNQEALLTEGTTPRRLTDLLGSLADLTSGSGDKGTPFILIQNYFINYSID